MLRSHDAGSLRAADAGKTVTLAGWVARRRDHGGVIFIDLRDSSGVAQVVFRDEGVLAQAHRLRAEFCVAVTGEYGQVTGYRSFATLPASDAPRVGDPLVVDTTNYVVDAIQENDGHTISVVLR